MSTTPCVLLVDDDPLVSFALTEALRDAGYAAIEAANTGEAIEVLRQTDRIRVLVTDVNMPGSVTGLGLVRVAQEAGPTSASLSYQASRCPRKTNFPMMLFFYRSRSRPAPCSS